MSTGVRQTCDGLGLCLKAHSDRPAREVCDGLGLCIKGPLPVRPTPTYAPETEARRRRGRS